MPAPRTCPAVVPLVVALIGGGAVACGGIATDYILVGSDGGGDETHAPRPPHVNLAVDAGRDVVGDSGADVVAVDAGADVVSGDEVNFQVGQCDEGLNTSYPPADCSGPSTYWLASPYRPSRDITVQRIELHTTSGSVAVLAAGGSGPGALLFTGSVGLSGGPEWLGTNVSPGLSLKGGELYYLAFEGSYCSQAQGGPEAVEYGSGSLAGPWTVTGTDNWTARVLGTCP
jgi:hypothetical protein